MQKSEQTIEERVIKILKDQFGPDKTISRDTQLTRDLGADSLDAVEIVMELEEEFKITIPEDDVKGLSYVEAIVKYVERKTFGETIKEYK